MSQVAFGIDIVFLVRPLHGLHLPLMKATAAAVGAALTAKQ